MHIIKYLIYITYVVLLLNPEFWIKNYPLPSYLLLANAFCWIQFWVLRARWLRAYRYSEYMVKSDARFWGARRKATA